MLEKMLVALFSSVVVVIMGIIAYFCKRMIDQNDKHFDKISSRFDKVDVSLTEIRKDLHHHDVTIEILQEKISSIEEDCPLLVKTP